MNKIDTSSKLKPAVTREYVPILGDLFMTAYSNVEYYKKMYDVEFYTRCGYYIGAFYYGDEAMDFGEVLVNKENSEKGYLDNLFEKIYNLGEELLKISKDINKQDYSDTKQEELLKIFKNFTDKYILFSLSLMGFNLQFVVEKKLREVLKNSKSIDDDLGVITFPKKENIAAYEQINLLKIGVEIEKLDIKNSKDLPAELKKKIIEHINEYSWISARGGLAKKVTIEEIFKRILDLGPGYKGMLEKQKNHKKDMQKKSEILVDKLGSTDNLNFWVKLAKELVYFRTYRTDYLNWIFFNIKPLLEAIAIHKGLTYKEILYLDVSEILGKKDFTKNEINRRMTNYSIMTVIPNKLIFTSDPNELKKIEEKYLEIVKGENITEFKGNIGFKGNVKGIVKIVVNKDDMIKVKRGDILVSPMTTPDFVPAMEKAIAFVTDEGGITCHAAIVAREMKKPCIIGTKIATKVLKDGMKIEVDAEKGIVKIIKN